MGEWMQRAALIEGKIVRPHQPRLSEPWATAPLPEPCHSEASEPDYRQHPVGYEFPRFVIPTADGPVEFQLAVPREKYDAFAILDLLMRYHGPVDSGSGKRANTAVGGS